MTTDHLYYQFQRITARPLVPDYTAWWPKELRAQGNTQQYSWWYSKPPPTGGLGRLVAWHLPDGPVGPPAKCAATSNVGRTIYPVNSKRYEKRGTGRREGQLHKGSEGMGNWTGGGEGTHKPLAKEGGAPFSKNHKLTTKSSQLRHTFVVTSS